VSWWSDGLILSPHHPQKFCGCQRSQTPIRPLEIRTVPRLSSAFSLNRFGSRSPVRAASMNLNSRRVCSKAVTMTVANNRLTVCQRQGYFVYNTTRVPTGPNTAADPH
jgi:hypothetical protein